MNNGDQEITLDLSNLLCPLPVLKARKVLESLASGQILTVLATDPMAALDMPHFAHEQGHNLLSQTKDGKTLIFRIKRR
jgi:tRNA 2-thiouridine synthesizing protein A